MPTLTHTQQYLSKQRTVWKPTPEPLFFTHHSLYLPLLFSGFIISIGPSCTFTDKLFASDCRSLGSPSVSDPLWFSAEAKSGRGHPRLPSDPLPPSKQTKRPMFLGISNDSQQLELNRHISFILLKQPFSLDLGTPLPPSKYLSFQPRAR